MLQNVVFAESDPIFLCAWASAVASCMGGTVRTPGHCAAFHEWFLMTYSQVSLVIFFNWCAVKCKFSLACVMTKFLWNSQTLAYRPAYHSPYHLYIFIQLCTLLKLMSVTQDISLLHVPVLYEETMDTSLFPLRLVLLTIGRITSVRRFQLNSEFCRRSRSQVNSHSEMPTGY